MRAGNTRTSTATRSNCEIICNPQFGFISHDYNFMLAIERVASGVASPEANAPCTCCSLRGFRVYYLYLPYPKSIAGSSNCLFSSVGSCHLRAKIRRVRVRKRAIMLLCVNTPIQHTQIPPCSYSQQTLSRAARSWVSPPVQAPPSRSPVHTSHQNPDSGTSSASNPLQIP